MCSDGLYPDISHDEYINGLAEWESRSGLLPLVFETPADYQHAKEVGVEETDPMRLGTAIHEAVLEPHKLEKYVEYPLKINRAIKDEAKAAAKGVMTADQAKAFAAEHQDSILLPAGELGRTQDLAFRVRFQPAVDQLLSGGRIEPTMLVTDEETGVKYKVRPDYFAPVTSDLKSTATLNPKLLEKSIWSRGYDIQAAMIKCACEALKLPWEAHTLIWVRTDPKMRPDVRVEYLDPWWIQRGTLLFKRALRTLAECRETDTWPGEPITIERRAAPTWGEKWLAEWLEDQLEGEHAQD